MRLWRRLNENVKSARVGSEKANAVLGAIKKVTENKTGSTVILMQSHNVATLGILHTVYWRGNMTEKICKG